MWVLSGALVEHLGLRVALRPKPHMSRISRPALFSLVILVTLGGCQFIGGLDDLHLGAGSGGVGGAGSAGAAGNGSTSASTGTNGVGGAGGGPPTTVAWSKRFGDGTTQYVTDVAVD